MDRLRSHFELTEASLRGLEQQLSEREATRPPGQGAKAGTVERGSSEPTLLETNPAPAEVSAPEVPAGVKRTTSGVVELTRTGIGEFERVLASAGIDVARLFSQFGMDRTEGGPFVPPPGSDEPAGGIIADALLNIRRLAKALPLSASLDHYQVGSRLGPRRPV